MDPASTAIFYTWAPILLMIGVWVFFMGKMRSTQLNRSDHAKRVEELLERIAAALERR